MSNLTEPWPADKPLPPEADLEKLKAEAAQLDDFQLDELVAVFDVRSRVAAAHHLPGVAGTWGDAMTAIADVRRQRTKDRRELDDIVTEDAHLYHLQNKKTGGGSE